MNDPAVAAQREQVRQQGFVIGLVTLPFRLFGVLCASLLLSIAVECIALHFFWPDEGWRHAKSMLDHELTHVSEDFARSALLREPGRSARWLIVHGYDWLFVKSGLLDGIRDASRRDAVGVRPRALDFRAYVEQLGVHVEDYVLAAAYTVLVFFVRLLVLTLSLPLFATAAFVGFVDGLVRRDVRRFGAERESAFVYHRARATLTPLLVLPWTLFLAFPVGVHPLFVLLPGAALLGGAVNIAAATFKKYL
jgi:integrating conjugative element membrane protein (TIGR03747 family)